MNRILLALFLVIPAMADAQSIDVRGFGGLMMNSGTYQSVNDEQPSKLNGMGGLGASFRSGHFEYGLNLAYRRYSFRKRLIFADEFDPVTGLLLPGAKYSGIYTFREPAFAIAPVLNYHFGRRKLDWYAGLSPAYVRFTNVSPTDRNFKLSRGINGFSVDAQFGCSYELLPRFRCFAELSGGSVWMSHSMADQTRFSNATLSIGAQFRVWERGKSAAPAGQ